MRQRAAKRVPTEPGSGKKDVVARFRRVVDGGRTGFYDWAAASQYPGMRDVAYFLTNSLPTEVRRAEQDALIARYLVGLAGAGINIADLLNKSRGEVAYTLIDVDGNVDSAICETIRAIEGVLSARIV